MLARQQISQLIFKVEEKIIIFFGEGYTKHISSSAEIDMTREIEKEGN